MNPAQEHVIFYYELGSALSQWAMVETALARVANSCYSPQQRKISHAGFFAIENFRSKCAYTEALIKEKFNNEKILAEWETIKPRLEAAARNRNKLAHRKVIGVLGEHKPGRGYALVAWDPEIKIKKSGAPILPQDAIYTLDIVRIRMEFSALWVTLENFSARLRKQKKPFPKTLEKAKNSPTIQMIASQIFAGA